MRMSCSISHGPRISLPAEQQHEHHPRDDRRDGKRQVDERDEQLLSAELKLADGPRGGHAEHEIRRHRDGGGRQRQAKRGHRVGFGDRVDISTPAEPERFGENGGQRQARKRNRKPSATAVSSHLTGAGSVRPLFGSRVRPVSTCAISSPASGCSSPEARSPSAAA